MKEKQMVNGFVGRQKETERHRQRERKEMDEIKREKEKIY